MGKREEKMTAPIDESTGDATQVMVICQKERARFVDGIKFGVGFYVGYKAARKLKNIIIAKFSKK